MKETKKYDCEKIVQAAKIDGFKEFLKLFKTKDEAVSAAVLCGALDYIQRNKVSFRKSEFFKELAQEIKLEKLKYIPKTWANLRNRVEAYYYEKPVTELVVVKNLGNQNASLLAKDDEGVLKQMLIDFGKSEKNSSYSAIWRKMREQMRHDKRDESLKKKRMTLPSIRWVSQHLAKPEFQNLIHSKYGSNSRFNAKYRAYVPTLKAVHAGDCWEIDGTRVNIIDHKATFTDKNGKRVQGNKFLYIIAVRDVMSGSVLGWEYCYEESAQATINALAMAVRNANYLPYEMRYDRFPGYNTAEWAFMEYELRSRGVTMTMTSKAEGKAGIERSWGTLQSVFMSESEYYYGEGIRSTRKYAHRSKEYVLKMRQKAAKIGFDFDDACRETDKILNAYINTPLSLYSRKYQNVNQSPAELHTGSTKPNVKEINASQFCYLFGLKKQLQVRNYMIQTEIAKAPYYYGIDDCDVIERYTGVALTCCFDWEDLEKVHLFDNRNFIGTFNRFVEAQQYGPDKDMRAVGKVAHIKQKMAENRKKKIDEALRGAAFDNDLECASPEVGALLTGRVKKSVYEAAESAFLRSEWEDENENIKVAVPSLY